MANGTVTLARDHAQQVKDALEIASDTVVALEWIAAQDGIDAGASEVIKSCLMRLSVSLCEKDDVAEIMRGALKDVNEVARHG